MGSGKLERSSRRRQRVSLVASTFVWVFVLATFRPDRWLFNTPDEYLDLPRLVISENKANKDNEVASASKPAQAVSRDKDSSREVDSLKSEDRLPLIPHTIMFTHKENILETKQPPQFYENVQNTIKTYMSFWNDTRAEVRFLTDKECREKIMEVEPKLVSYFDAEKDGGYKADICRVATLYLIGGYYFDTDIRVVEPVELNPNVTFSTVQGDVYDTNFPGEFNFFQAFLASAPRHPILRETLRITLAYYEGKHELHGWMGTSIMADAFKSVNALERGDVKIFEEINNVSWRKTFYANIPRQLGKGCCCNHLVHDQGVRKVYFYSRIVGAGRNCMNQEQWDEDQRKKNEEKKQR